MSRPGDSGPRGPRVPKGPKYGSVPTAKRSPSILVTDVRNKPAGQPAPFAKSHFQTPPGGPSSNLRFSQGLHKLRDRYYGSGSYSDVSVDEILSGISDIPSGQRREMSEDHPLLPRNLRSQAARYRPRHSSPLARETSTGSGNSSNIRTPGRQLRLPPKRINTLPPRTSKTSQKLVYIPEDGVLEVPELPGKIGENRRHGTSGLASKDHKFNKFARATAYCVSEGFNLQLAATFLRGSHKVQPRLYDEVLYAAYSLPLLSGEHGFRIRSNTSVKTFTGESLMEQMMDRSEQEDHHFEYYSGQDDREDRENSDPGDSERGDTHGASTGHGSDWGSPVFDPSEPQYFSPPRELIDDVSENGANNGIIGNDSGTSGNDSGMIGEDVGMENNDINDNKLSESDIPINSDNSTANSDLVDMSKHAEIFIFQYGVVMFWNFTESQEKDVLADLTFANVELENEEDDEDDDDDDNNTSSPSEYDDINSVESNDSLNNGSNDGPLLHSLVIRPIHEQDIEIESFYFEYSNSVNRPRIYNDIITIKSGDHMIKLTMSHAIAQSTKLCLFEARMGSLMSEAKKLPKRLALTGRLGLKREQIIKLSGRLFKLRVDVNLSSSVLDTPDFFWSSEPSLNPLYAAVREYLEIEERVLVLNERCKVFLDLTDIIAESIAETKLSRVALVIVLLIGLSLLVSMLEIFVRYNIIRKGARAP